MHACMHVCVCVCVRKQTYSCVFMNTSLTSFFTLLQRWHHRRMHTHQSDFSHLDESDTCIQRLPEEEELREGFAMGFGTVWAWNALMANTGTASQGVAHGMRGDGVGVGDIGEVPSVAWRTGDAALGYDKYSTCGQCDPSVVGGRGDDERD